MNTTTKTFKELTKKFNWVNPSIEPNFPLVDRKLSDYKLFHFDEYISSEDVVKEIEKEGYMAANLLELLSWDGWNEKDCVVALGSVGAVYSVRDVPCLGRGDSERRLRLRWWDGGWGARCRFLGVKVDSKEKRMKGHSIAGMSTTRDRVEDDFYATPTESTKALLAVEEIIYPAWEPACGEGHISKLLTGGTVFSSDLIDRGYGVVKDFLEDDGESGSETIITNPPFNLFQEFAEKALKTAQKKVILFGKLQALEGQKRATFMQNSPLRTVYVFKARQNPLRNGSSVDEKGKPWASTMAFAWFVWEIGYKGKPTIEWI